jgi:ABC-2 type transport system permease protein
MTAIGTASPGPQESRSPGLAQNAADGAERAREPAVARGLRHEVTVALAVWGREWTRLRRRRTQLLIGLLQPVLLLTVFGVGLSRVADTGSGTGYAAFVLPGVVSITVVNAALSQASSVVWDREFGFLREMLVAPANRVSVLVGTLAGAVTAAVLQGGLVLLLAPAFGVPLDVGHLVAALGAMVLVGLACAAVGLLMAARARQVQDAQGVVQLAVMPMMFLSGAFFPLDRAPDWLRVVGTVDPVSFGVDLVRRPLTGAMPDAGALGLTHSAGLEVTVLLVILVLALWGAVRRFAVPD